MNVTEVIKQYKLVPVVVINDMAETKSALSGLVNGGLPIAEICFRTACAEEAIRYAVKEYPQMLVGAGTVINTKQCEQALTAGAQFIVSPGLSDEVALLCRERRVPYFPGVVTATEIMRALSLGIDVVKFFPAENYGGLKTIKALSAAFPNLAFLPTGGINENNVTEYLSFAKVVACGGSWMVKGTADEIEEKTKNAMNIIARIQKGDKS